MVNGFKIKFYALAFGVPVQEEIDARIKGAAASVYSEIYGD